MLQSENGLARVRQRLGEMRKTPDFVPGRLSVMMGLVIEVEAGLGFSVVYCVSHAYTCLYIGFFSWAWRGREACRGVYHEVCSSSRCSKQGQIGKDGMSGRSS